jgi:hypothetical protein
MRPVLFLTSEEHRELTADDRLAAVILESRGITVRPLIWTDPNANLKSDLLVIRSPWDWTAHGNGFDAFLAKLEAEDIRFENRSARRFADKTYLATLQARGASVVPSRFIRAGESIEDSVRASGWSQLVMKPSLSAGARRTVRFAAHDLASHLALANEILSEGTLLIQPFLPEIETTGEWSLIFFDGELSHAIKKRPKRGDFRVQDDFGGTVTVETPPPFVIDGARRALAAAQEEFLYARVDGVVSESFGGFLVNELEVVEPELFLRCDAGAPKRFADAIEKRVRASR